MILTRRSLLIAAPAVVAAGSLMPVRDWVRLDPLAAGIRYQTWPFDTLRPYYHTVGSIGSASDHGAARPASEWIDSVKRHSREPVYWRLIWYKQP